jgi:DNA invertase Pin-like site-specific DNA recombinase
MNTYIYARVSTDRQNHDSQLQELRDYCQRRGWNPREEIIDTASGAKFSREGLDRLLTLVRKGRVDVLVCYKLDRLGRSLAHLSQILGELTRHRTALVVPSQGIDTTSLNPAAQLQLNILCAVAEFEREVIRERVLAGLSAARKRGQHLGRPNSTARHLPQVARLLAEGKGTSAVSRELRISLGSASKLVAMARSAQSLQSEAATLTH